MNKIVTLINLSKPMEDLGDEIMDETEIPTLGSCIALDSGEEVFIPKFKTEDEESHKVTLYGEIKSVSEIFSSFEQEEDKELIE